MQVTTLDLTVAGIASAQQRLEWQHRRQQGATSSSTGSRRQQPQRGVPPNLLQHLASRMPQLSQLKLFYNTVAQVCSDMPSAGDHCCLFVFGCAQWRHPRGYSVVRLANAAQ